MYVFQHSDGSWRIALLTHSKGKVPYGDQQIMALYDGVYERREDAEFAVRAVERLQGRGR